MELVSGFIVRLSVAALSHPKVLKRCAVCAPPPVKVSPFQVNGSSVGQILISVVEVLTGSIIRCKEAKLSQPARLVSVAVCVPPEAKVRPFQL